LINAPDARDDALNLTRDDVRAVVNDTGKYIAVAWPETGVWYDAKVVEINAKSRTATLWYPPGEDEETGEEEDINLEEAILDDEVSWPVYRDEEHAAAMMRGRVLGHGRKPSGTRKPVEKSEQDVEAERKVRDKVRASVQDALELAVKETKEIGEEASNGEPDVVAKAVEEALFAACANDAGKEYRTKARSLMFNLKDAHNPQLRARVLADDLKPQRFVMMSPAELANKELIEWRKKREQNIGEDAFLTGVALEDLVVKKDGKNEMHVEIKKDLPQPTVDTASTVDLATAEKGMESESPQKKAKIVDDDQDDEDNKDVVSEPEPEPEVIEREPEPEPDEFVSFEDFANGGNASGDVDEEEEEEDEEEYEPEYEPEPEFVAEEEYDPEVAEYEPETAAAPSDDDENAEEEQEEEVTPLSIDGWEGKVLVHGLPDQFLRVIPVGGECASLADLLSESVSVKGRVDYKAVQSFAKQVHHNSTSRAVTLAHISAAPSGGEDAARALEKLIKHYRERKRAGLAQTTLGGEFYLVPRGSNAEKVLHYVPLEPGQTMPSDGMLGVVIHPRGTGPNVKEIQPRAAKRPAEDEDEDYQPTDDPSTAVPPPPPAHNQYLYQAQHVAHTNVPPPPPLRNVPPPPQQQQQHFTQVPPPPPPTFAGADLQALIDAQQRQQQQQPQGQQRRRPGAADFFNA